MAVQALNTSGFPQAERTMLKIIPVMITMVAMMMMLGLIVAATGVIMQSKVPVVEAQFHSQLDAYYGKNSKAQRDGAAADSALTKQLVELNKFPSRLLELKLVGVGRILTGIFIILFGIQGALVMMPFRVRKVLRQVQQTPPT